MLPKLPKGIPKVRAIDPEAKGEARKQTQREQAFWRYMAQWAQEIKEKQEDDARRLADRTTIARSRGIVFWWLYIKDKEDEKYKVWSWD